MDCLKEAFPILETLEKIAVIAGFIFAMQQWFHHKKQLQHEYTEKFSSSLMRDKDIADFIRMIERDGGIGFSTYSENGTQIGVFDNPENERKTDYALTVLSNFIVLKKKKVIKEENFQFFNYVLIRTLKNSEIKAYLRWLQNFAKNECSPFPYKILVDYTNSFFIKE